MNAFHMLLNIWYLIWYVIVIWYVVLCNVWYSNVIWCKLTLMLLMCCGPKRIQPLSVSDHGSHCTLLQKRDDDWWQIPSWFPGFHGFARSLIIRGLHEYSMRSCFERPLYHLMYHHISRPLYHQMYHHVSRPPSTNLNYAADHFAQPQSGGNFKIRNIWFSYKTFLPPSREDVFFCFDTKAWAELVGLQWKLEIGGSAQRSKGAHLGGADLWTELYSLPFFAFLFSFCPYIWLSVPNLCNGVFSICFIFCQSKTRN